jgi:hypothetical protein
MRLRKGDRVIATRRVGNFFHGYIEPGTLGVIVDERDFLGFGASYEVAFEIHGRVERRHGLAEGDIAPI